MFENEDEEMICPDQYKDVPIVELAGGILRRRMQYERAIEIDAPDCVTISMKRRYQASYAAFRLRKSEWEKLLDPQTISGILKGPQ